MANPDRVLNPVRGTTTKESLREGVNQCRESSIQSGIFLSAYGGRIKYNNQQRVSMFFCVGMHYRDALRQISLQNSNMFRLKGDAESPRMDCST